MSEIKLCHDCGCKEGELHSPGCDMERCPLCGGQLITCGHLAFDSVRIPYIQYPNICQYCGELWPEMFHVHGDEWEKYIEPRERDKIFCWECYSLIKNLIDMGAN